MKKKALITGINGQDGSFLAELLLTKGYEVHGLVRREAFESAQNRLANIHPILDRITLHVGSASNQLLISKLLSHRSFDECYHLAATSFVSYELDAETTIFENNFHSTHYLLANIKNYQPHCRFYFAGSSEMMGKAVVAPQTEDTPFHPRSIYGISKMAGAILSRNYREQHNLFTCNGILYNHESYRRSSQFVTRKITSTVAKIAKGLAHELTLGNLDAQRDWGYAPEYVEAMWQMLNQDEAGDYIIATGVLHSVKDLVECAFGCVNLDYQNYVKVDPAYHRQQEVVPLVGNSQKAAQKFGWQPQKHIFNVIDEMIHYDLKKLTS